MSTDDVQFRRLIMTHSLIDYISHKTHSIQTKWVNGVFHVLIKDPMSDSLWHLMPCSHDVQTTVDFYADMPVKIRDMAHARSGLLPNEADIELILKYATQNPLVENTAAKLFHKLKVDNVYDLLRKCLIEFSTNRDPFVKLDGPHKALVVQCLLAALPQFESGLTAFDREIDNDRVTEGIEWWSKTDKLDLFESQLANVKATLPIASRLFLLLSIVESTQWIGDEVVFGVVRSVSDFLKQPARTQHLRNYSFYIECSPKTDDEKTKLAIELRDFISTQSNSLQELFVDLLCATTRRSYHFLGDCNHASPISQARALIGYIAPKNTTIARRCQNKIELLLKIWRDEPLLEGGTLADTEIQRVFTDGWGLFKTSSNNADIPNQIKTLALWDAITWGAATDGTRYFAISIPTLDSSQICILLDFDEERDKLDLLLEHYNSVAALLFRTELASGLRLASCEPIKFPVQADWYKTAFDAAYIEFDQERHKLKSEEHNARDGEVKSYIARISALTDTLGREPEILDIGVGYCRLAEPILKTKQSLLNHYKGVDLSSAMCARAKQTLGVSNVFECDMLNLDNKVPHGPYDLVLFTYTTFGCLENELANVEVLKSVAERLNFGGQLIIEQHNPYRSSPPTERLIAVGPLKVTCSLAGREWTGCSLAKTSNYEKRDSYTLYSGVYHFMDSATIITSRPYAVRLYNENWFKQVLEPLGFDISVFYDFSEVFTAPNANAALMIIQAVKTVAQHMTSKMVKLASALKTIPKEINRPLTWTTEEWRKKELQLGTHHLASIDDIVLSMSGKFGTVRVEQYNKAVEFLRSLQEDK